MADPDDRWYFAKDRLSESPSRKHGFDADKELSCRQQAANFIQDMGQKLCVSQLCINTAIVYMHRFYVFHSLVQFHRNAIATAALFLAAKVEEQPRKVEHVLKVAHLCLHRDAPSLDTKSEMYMEQSNDLVVNESILLQTLGFDVAIDHPHTHVVRCCQLVKASKDLAQTSYFMASNSLHLTTMCLQYKPTVVACFCIHLACKWSNWEIPRSSEGKDWFWYVNQSVTLDLLEQLTSEFLLIFDKCPTKLKRKMMSLNQNNPPVNFSHLGGSQENCHFDEPRKLMGAEANRPPESFLQMQKSSEKTTTNNNSNNGSNTQAQSQTQPQQPNNSTRHIDYKEYKEKKEREKHDRERVDRIHRETSSSTSVAPAGSHTHGSTKPHDKSKTHSSQRPSSNAQAHKNYPQQRSHSTNSSTAVTKDGHQQRSTVKEAVKRKYDEVDNNGSSIDSTPNAQDSTSSKSHPRNPEEFRQKVPNQGQNSNPNFTAPPQETSHNQTKDYTASGIRDIITQSFGQREKSQRPSEGERSFQNYPYPRNDKYNSSSGRSSQPTVIAKTAREESSKKVDETNRSTEENNSATPDWNGKTNSSVPGHSQNHGTERHSSMSHQQIKQRDSKVKSHHQTPQKEQKHPINLMQGGMHNSTSGHKKSAEKNDKNRKHQEQQPLPVVERGLPASMDSLLDESRPKQVEQKRHHGDSHKKEKHSSSSKMPSKQKSSNLISPVKSQEPLHVSLFDIPHNSDLELPSLVDKVERPAKIPRLDDNRKKLFEHDQHKSYLVSEPMKTSSIFSPENNISPKNNSSYDKESRKSDLHFSNPNKKLNSLFSPPSMPGMLSHRSGSSSSSSERELVLPITSLATPVIKHEKEIKLENDNMLPSLGENTPEQKYKDKSMTDLGSLGVINANTTHGNRHISSNRHTPLNEAGAIVFPPSDKSKPSNSFPKIETTPETNTSSPVSTVNLLGMEKMVDTSISPTLSAVIKPLAVVRPEQSAKIIPQIPSPATVNIAPPPPVIALIPPIAHPTKDEEKNEDEKSAVIIHEDSHRKHKKKEREKDREGHRHHKDKKRSEGKKEKKKHKDKDRERKKDSHRDKEKHRDKSKDVQDVPMICENSLKITIPKDKITEGSLKIKIAKDRLKPEDIEGVKLAVPEGSLKIKIKKDIIANFKEDKSSSKRKDGSSHSSHHKSSKSSKSSDHTSSRSSKKLDQSKSNSSNVPHAE